MQLDSFFGYHGFGRPLIRPQTGRPSSPLSSVDHFLIIFCFVLSVVHCSTSTFLSLMEKIIIEYSYHLDDGRNVPLGASVLIIWFISAC